jgi:phospholipid/cholesterol/gamma-HCH transport system substrate-binding protein
MGKRVSPALIGAFVLGAVALVVVALLAFGSGRLFRTTEDFICNFGGSVNGLVKGAPVKFRGVQIGEVTSIRFVYESQDGTPRISVGIAIDPDEMAALGAERTHYDDAALNEAIDRGLRAQLQLQSIITGVLFVGLDLLPGSPIDLVLPRLSHSREIPTLPTQFERLQEKFQLVVNRLSRIDYEAFATALKDAVDGVNKLVNSPDMTASVAALRHTLDDTRALVADARARLGPLTSSFQSAGTDAQATLQRLQVTIDKVQSLLAPDAPLAYELTRTVVDLGEAARAVRALADYLERNPRALLTGKAKKE